MSCQDWKYLPLSSSKISAVILAAGLSRRMGSINKLLIELDGKSVLRRSVEHALAAAFWETIVVTGSESERVSREIEDLDVRCVFNAGYKQGMAGSIITGVKAISPHSAGVIILTADMPLLRSETLCNYKDRFASGARIVAGKNEAYLGVPVLFHRRFFPELQSLAGDRGAKILLEKHAAQVSTVDIAEEELPDIDKPEDLNLGREAP